MRSQVGSELMNLCYRLRRFIHTKDLVPTSEKVDKIPPRPAPRIQHPHARHKPTLQQLVEDVDINPTKPLLKIIFHAQMIRGDGCAFETVGVPTQVLRHSNRQLAIAN